MIMYGSTIFTLGKRYKKQIMILNLKGQLQRSDKFIPDERFCFAENGFEVVFQNSVSFPRYKPSKLRKKRLRRFSKKGRDNLHYCSAAKRVRFVTSTMINTGNCTVISYASGRLGSSSAAQFLTGEV